MSDSNRPTKRARVANSTSVADVVDTIELLSDGYGNSIDDIIKAFRQRDPMVSADDVVAAINTGLQSGELTAPFGINNSMIAVTHVLRSYFESTTWDFRPLSAYMDDLEHLEGNVAAWILASNTEIMLDYGYLEANNRLQVRRSPQVVWSNSGSLMQF